MAQHIPPGPALHHITKISQWHQVHREIEVQNINNGDDQVAATQIMAFTILYPRTRRMVKEDLLMALALNLAHLHTQETHRCFSHPTTPHGLLYHRGKMQTIIRFCHPRLRAYQSSQQTKAGQVNKHRRLILLLPFRLLGSICRSPTVTKK